MCIHKNKLLIIIATTALQSEKNYMLLFDLLLLLCSIKSLFSLDEVSYDYLVTNRKLFLWSVKSEIGHLYTYLPHIFKTVYVKVIFNLWY